jgi:hypothetical protein
VKREVKEKKRKEKKEAKVMKRKRKKEGKLKVLDKKSKISKKRNGGFLKLFFLKKGLVKIRIGIIIIR